MKDIRNAICRINAVSKEFKESNGTGFFIDSSIILTSNHVLTVLDNISTLSFSIYQEPEKTSRRYNCSKRRV